MKALHIARTYPFIHVSIPGYERCQGMEDLKDFLRMVCLPVPCNQHISVSTEQPTDAFFPDSTSICSSAPSLSDLDEELSQYSQYMDSQTLQEVLGNSHLLQANSNPTDISIKNNEPMCSTQTEDSGNSTLEQCIDSPDSTSGEVLKTAELDSLLMPPPPSLSSSKGGQVEPDGIGGLIGPRPTVASLGIKESIEECLKAPTGNWYFVKLLL